MLSLLCMMTLAALSRRGTFSRRQCLVIGHGHAVADSLPFLRLRTQARREPALPGARGEAHSHHLTPGQPKAVGSVGSRTPSWTSLGNNLMQSYPLKMGGLSVVSSGPVGTGLAVFLVEQATRARRHKTRLHTCSANSLIAAGRYL